MKKDFPTVPVLYCFCALILFAFCFDCSMTTLLLPLDILLANSKIFNNNNQNGIIDIVMDFTFWLECRQSTTDDERFVCKRQDIADWRIPFRN